MTALNLVAACFLDGVLGDPRWMPHPVRLMGAVIGWCDDRIRKATRTPFGQRSMGIVLALSVPGFIYGLSWWVLEVAFQFHDVVGDLVWIASAYTTLAARDLAGHAMAVYQFLSCGSLTQARSAVSMIVGRDTADLSKPEIVRATVETVAESTSDGVIAPLLYLVVGGPPLALAYKAINTMDSIIGHDTPTHRYVGWASAKLDDVANWMPSRISGVLIVLASGLRFGTGRDAWRVYQRDKGKHASPNSGHPEAAMAGALGIQLGGVNFYDGAPVHRPQLGDGGASLGADHITLAVQLMWITFGLGLTLGLLVVLLWTLF